MYARNTIHSADDLRRVADYAGSHFFDDATMRFFSSRLLEGVYPAASNDGKWDAKPGNVFYFVTSDANDFDGRKYSVRRMTLDTDGVDIETVDDAYRLDTAREAKREAERIAFSA